MLINEIFTSIDGEAKRAGELATFVRTGGCNLRCSYCDSKYTWVSNSSDTEMTVDEIVSKCKQFSIKNITFTGGEPLLQKDSDELITKLSENGFDVGIETNGSIDFTERDWFKNNIPNVWVCADFKCYCSSEWDKMLPIDKFYRLRSYDVLKFVVGSKRDLNLASAVIDQLRRNDCDCYIYLSPVFDMIKPVEIVEYMKKYHLEHKIRVQLQLHKLIWDPMLRGV